MADLEVYETSDGLVHWPDANLGSEKYYGILLTMFLAAENDTLVDVDWTVPSGLTEMETDTVGDEVRIKLSADVTGAHKIICTFDTTESGDTQKFKQVMMLNVIQLFVEYD